MGVTGEGASQGLPFHFIASFSTMESLGVPEGCCCWLRRRSERSGRCDRSSLIEPGSGVTLLIYLRPDVVTAELCVCSGPAVLYSLSKMAVLSHKMIDSSFKMTAPPALDASGRSSVHCSRDWGLQTAPSSSERCPHHFIKYATFRFCHQCRGLGNHSCFDKSRATSVLKDPL